jgi:UDPglucose--hexose-1-phosphate uridylyltransferase
MPELRQDPTTKEWVVIANERAKRPEQFGKRLQREPGTEPTTSSCPFCPGNEDLTPKEILALRSAGGENTPGWRIRVVPNRFAAFLPGTNSQYRNEGPLFHAKGAIGSHEVIIETPHHNRNIALMDTNEIAELLDVFRQRYETLRKDQNVKLILLFRNHGPTAGTSLPHPHSQLVAMPIIPAHIRRKYEVAIEHFDDTGRCLYCDVEEEERSAAKRVVFETAGLLVFHPFASQVPFETWIIPKRHEPCFARITAEERRDLADTLRRVLRILHDTLGNPDFNLIFHTAPIEDEDKPYFLWHVEIRPRLTTAAGFEIGTGIYINTAVPEETALFFRSELAKV